MELFLLAVYLLFISSTYGIKEFDKIETLPGQPKVNFDQYAGYVDVNRSDGRSLFYYFVESSESSATKPLMLWLHGGPGCSSLIGAMEELGPFRVKTDGKTLYENEYSWNKGPDQARLELDLSQARPVPLYSNHRLSPVANIIFLESPAGVGFSFSNSTSIYSMCGDKSAAQDSFNFLVNWLERFPEYKGRDFFISGESYAGHYIPQLAQKINLQNKKANKTVVNLRGVAIGNGLINDVTDSWGTVDYLWTHALISDEAYRGIHSSCDYYNSTETVECHNFILQARKERCNVDIFNIDAPRCQNPTLRNGFSGSVLNFDPCLGYYARAYFNLPEVQKAFHAKPTAWERCRLFNWRDSPTTVLPVIKSLMASGTRIWMYSGDRDTVVSVTGTRYSLNAMKLSIQTSWYAWYCNKEVAGYVIGYKGLTFVTVRQAGHNILTTQPERALLLITSFLQGVLPPWTLDHPYVRVVDGAN